MANLGCTTHGATMVIPPTRSTPTAVLEAVEAEHCTALYGVPTMFIAELAHPEFDRYDLSSLRTGVMAGSPCPVEVMKQCVDRMHMDEVTICYGMTGDVAGVDPDAARRLAPPPHGDRRSRPPARRDPHRRPGAPLRRSPAARSASSAPAATR